MKRAQRELQLPFNAAEGIPAFDTSEHETYTEEDPNSLTGEETAMFLATTKDEFPAQYAMAFLGFATGVRPSSMRPLRRTGPTPDVLWDAGVILVRRSHTIGVGGARHVGTRGFEPAGSLREVSALSSTWRPPHPGLAWRTEIHV